MLNLQKFELCEASGCDAGLQSFELLTIKISGFQMDDYFRVRATNSLNIINSRLHAETCTKLAVKTGKDIPGNFYCVKHQNR